MTKILPLPPHLTNSDKLLIQGCWILSYNALWLYDRLPGAEVSYAQKSIQHILKSSISCEPFIEFTEKLLLSYKLLKGDQSKWIDLPSLWFNPHFPEGFSNAESLYKSVLQRRKDIKGYQKGILVFASNYYQYIKEPSDQILKRCYGRLLQLREYDLLQLWSNVITHFHINK